MNAYFLVNNRDFMVFHYYFLVIILKQKPMLLMFLNYINICDILCDIMDYSPQGSSVHGDSPGKNTGVGCHALPQGIFPTQGLNPGRFFTIWATREDSGIENTFYIYKILDIKKTKEIILPNSFLSQMSYI